MKIKFFHRYFLIAFLSILFFIIIGFVFQEQIMRYKMSQYNLEMPQFFSEQRIKIAQLIDRINSTDKVSAFKVVSEMLEGFPGPSLALVDEKGELLFPQNFPYEINLNGLNFPQNVYESTNVPQEKLTYKSIQGQSGAIPIPKNLPPSAPPFGGPPLEIMESYLILMKGNPKTYLLFAPPIFFGPHQSVDGKSKIPFQNRPEPPMNPMIFLAISLTLGIVFTFSIINYLVSKKVKQADEVLSELQKGNLKARFQITRKDEFGQAMMRFNTMADEIEKLVEHLKSVEKERSKLLQELAHDLRTPITSVKNFLETLEAKSEKMNEDQKKKFLRLSLEEIHYFERLVEDLLILSQVNEPMYLKEKRLINIGQLLEDTIEKISERLRAVNSEITIETDFDIDGFDLKADWYLMERLFRNALENAVSFAQKKVSVSFHQNDDKELVVIISDDGPGFSNEMLVNFGKRRFSRQVSPLGNGRLSVGLGSVVMKAITEGHNGKLEVSNIVSSTNEKLGARVTLSFKV